MSDVFSPDGLLASKLPGFEYRPQQGTMAQLVAETLREGGVTLIEAGTGTGKSLAYLIPAALFALQSGERVIISTNTINLQEQLIQKDIPWVQSAFAPELKAVLVKGWQNYLCLQRYENVLHQTADLLDPGDEGQLAAIRTWVAKGPKDGSRTELPFTPSHALWSSISAESDTCTRQQCPFYDHCYLFKARREVEDAQLIVVNHHLLFADVAVKNVIGWQSEAVLPPYARVVLDEAHHIEDVATEHLGTRFSELGWRQYLGRVARVGRSGERRGHLATMMSKLLAAGAASSAAYEHTHGTLLGTVERTNQLSAELFSSLSDWAGQHPQGSNETEWPIVVDQHWVNLVLPAAQMLASGVRTLGKELEQLASLLRELGDQWSPDAQESEALGSRALRAAEALEWLAGADDPEQVFWLEARQTLHRGLQFSLCSAPLEVGPHLNRWIGEALKSTVMCSATLTVGGSFDYVLGRLGLQEHDEREPEGKSRITRTVTIDSPFDYARQMALYVPSDIVEPTHAAFSSQFVSSLRDLLIGCGGRAFVLFTSYAQLKQTAAALRDGLAREGLPLWVQGEASRSHLLRSYLDHPGSVLFGTDSFWEGVDVRGDALSLVVIAKLPFEVPTHPIAKARTEHLQNQGLNPFQNYSVPRAALKLKQGFGRLIRSSSDRGAVVLYDRRVISRSYGRILLSSLPKAPLSVHTLRELPAAVQGIVNGSNQ